MNRVKIDIEESKFDQWRNLLAGNDIVQLTLKILALVVATLVIILATIAGTMTAGFTLPMYAGGPTALQAGLAVLVVILLIYEWCRRHVNRVLKQKLHALLPHYFHRVDPFDVYVSDVTPPKDQGYLLASYKPNAYSW